MLTLYGYTKCSTVAKAKKYLDDNKIEYKFIDFVANKLTVDEIRTLHQKSNLEIKKFFNSSGMLYREMNLKDVVKNISDEEAYQLLATNGMLVKRPILETKSNVLVGFKKDVWEEYL